MPASRLHLLIVVIDLIGGTGTFCRLLATGLKRYYGPEFEISLLLCRDRGRLPEDSQWFDRIEIINADVHTDFRRLYEPILHAFQLRKAIRRIAPDLILTAGTYSNLIVPLVAGGRPCILSEHLHMSTRLKSARFGRIIAMLMRLRHHHYTVVAPAQGVVDDLRQNFAVTKAQAIPHGIDPARVIRLAEEPVEDRPAQLYIVACGRLAAQKDYPTLIRAFARARDAGIPEHLVIIGGGEEEENLKRLANSLGLTEVVHFVGHRDNPYPYMKNASLFVLSSLWEGFGIVIIEAMALGLPCLSTDCPSGPAEILRDGRHGLLVPPGEPGLLADAIVKLSSLPSLRAELSRQSILRAGELSLQRMASEYRDLFLRERPTEKPA
jgi:glycosyltransferase involved in cell wall biosynthesis